MNQSLFIFFLNYVIWLIWNIVQNLCSVCLSRKISNQKEEEKERQKEKEKV